MHYKLFLIIAIINICRISPAYDQNYDDIIQRYIQKVELLEDKVANFEKRVKIIETQLGKNEFIATQSSFSMTDLDSLINQTKTKDQNIEDDLVNSEKEKLEYDLALAALKEEQFENAEQLFSDFMNTYPSSKLQSNARFWYAEIFFRRKIFDKAAINYLKNYKNYPKGLKASDSLLKLADSLVHLNKDKEACSIITELETEFSKRPIDSIKRTNDLKNKLQCDQFY